MRPERAPEQGSERARCFCYNPGFERDVWRGNIRGLRTTLLVAPSGRISLEPDPGLKPWAILFCHFMADAFRGPFANRPTDPKGLVVDVHGSDPPRTITARIHTAAGLGKKDGGVCLER